MKNYQAMLDFWRYFGSVWIGENQEVYNWKMDEIMRGIKTCWNSTNDMPEIADEGGNNN
jgi:hypothetical protein